MPTTEISKGAEMILAILYWERERPQPVTLAEMARRMNMDAEAISRRFRELLDAGMIEKIPPEA